MTGVPFEIVAIALIAAAASPAVSKTPPPKSPLISAVEACQAIADGSLRLACFDRAGPALVAAARAGDVAIVDRVQLRAARRSLFGFSMPRLPFFSGDDSADETADVLDTRIKTARAVGNGRYRMVIVDGDAQWETTESFANFREPRSGQKVQIKRGALGSYLLKIDGQRGVRGKRIG